MTVWLIIAGILLVGFGGVFYLLPSKRDRQLARIRQLARVSGLTIETVFLEKKDAKPEEIVSAGGKKRHPTRMYTSYRKDFRLPLDHAPRWRLVKDDASEYPLQGWALDGKLQINKIKNKSEYWDSVRSIVNGAPERCFGFDANDHFVAWLGIEQWKNETPESFQRDLNDMLEKLSHLHASIHKNHVSFDDSLN